MLLFMRLEYTMSCYQNLIQVAIVFALRSSYSTFLSISNKNTDMNK